jgi:hypothetical protein
MHNQREKALQGSAARAAAEGLTSEHDVRAYTKALWAQQQQAACSAEAEQRRQARRARRAASAKRLPNPGPQPPPPGPNPDAAARGPGGRPQPLATTPLHSGGLAALDARYAAVGLADADVPGDGDCLLYAALGRAAAGTQSAQPTA